MPPAALALIDAVFQLALHHDRRGRSGPLPNHASASVRAEIRGPLPDPAIPGCIAVDIVITLIPKDGGAPEERRVDCCIDLDDERLLAASVSLAEIPLDRSGLALLIGELESWCYEHIPVRRMPDDGPAEDADADE